MGNVVGLPEMVIPVAFNPVASGSPRQNPTSVGIYAPPNQDSKVMIYNHMDTKNLDLRCALSIMVCLLYGTSCTVSEHVMGH